MSPPNSNFISSTACGNSYFDSGRLLGWCAMGRTTANQCRGGPERDGRSRRQECQFCRARRGVEQRRGAERSHLPAVRFSGGEYPYQGDGIRFLDGSGAVEGAGSGFVIDAKGYILTNFHVVQGAQTIEVVLGDQSRHSAKFIGADQRNDVALIKIDPAGKPLAVLPLGDSAALQVGQKVLAIGNPFGFQSTLTTGVVSALGRTVQTGQNTLIDEAIQTDAAINRGNSGGPLINTHGEVIGINSAIYTPSGTTAGIGFAIPINTAKLIAHDLITDGRVHQAFLGVETIPINESFAEALGLPAQEGLLVQTTTRGGPAAQAGIKGGDRVAQAGMRRFYIGGDVITAIDGQKVSSPLDVNLALNKKRPGDTVDVTLFRGGKKMDLQIKLAERPGNN